MMPLVAAGVIGLAVIAGGAWYFLTQAGGAAVPVDQSVTDARETLAADDPLGAARGQIQAGGKENLGAALGALIAISNDATMSDQDRMDANILIAEMYDPETHDTARSPFDRPDPSGGAPVLSESGGSGV